MERFNSSQPDIFRLEIDESAKANFLEMARWTKFLAILGFILLALVVVAGAFMSLLLPTFAENYGGTSPLTNLGAAGPLILIVIFVIIAGIYIYPTYALYKYATCIKTALTTDNKEQFNRAIKYLKNMFKYIGILMVIFLAMYGLEIIIGIFSAMGK